MNETEAVEVKALNLESERLEVSVKWATYQQPGLSYLRSLDCKMGISICTFPSLQGYR